MVAYDWGEWQLELRSLSNLGNLALTLGGEPEGFRCSWRTGNRTSSLVVRTNTGVWPAATAPRFKGIHEW